MPAVHLRLDDLHHDRRSRDLLRDGETVGHAIALMIRPAKEAAGENSLLHTRQIVERAHKGIAYPALLSWDLAPWSDYPVLSVAGLAGSGLAACRYLIDPEGRVHAAPDAWTVLCDRHENRLPEDDLWWREFFEPFAANLEAGWRQEVERLLAQYATPPGAWWAIRLDWTVDRAKALDISGHRPADCH